MIATCQRKPISAAISLVSQAIPTRTPKPILVHAKLTIDQDGATTLTATDLEVAITTRVFGVDSKAAQPGSVLLSPKFAEILAKSSDSDAVTIDAEGDALHVRTKSGKFKLPTDDPSLYPAAPGWEAASWWIVPAGVFKKMIRRTVFATDGNESTRYALGGVMFAITADTLQMVSTDGRRLSVIATPADTTATPPHPAVGSPVVPTKALKIIDRMLDDEDGTVEIAWVTPAGKPDAPPTAILVRTGDGATTVYSRLVEGRFPRHQDVFPPEPEFVIDLDVVALRAAVEQAAILTSDESRAVEFSFGVDGLTLSSSAADLGSSEIQMPLMGPAITADRSVKIHFDPRYLTDWIKSLGEDDPVEVRLIDHKTAAHFVSGSASYIVMPLTVDK